MRIALFGCLLFALACGTPTQPGPPGTPTAPGTLSPPAPDAAAPKPPVGMNGTDAGGMPPRDP